MPNLINRAGKSRLAKHGSPSMTLLAIMPAFAICYILLILPFFPDDGKGRVENILFWPILAVLVLTLVFLNRTQIDYRFFRSLPIASLIAYLVFAAASVTWAFSPDFAFSRLVVQVLALIVVVAPYAISAAGRYAIQGVYLFYVLALALSAVYVLTTPPSPIGHPGYFTHKQELGLLAAIGVILSSYEFFQGGWRRIVAPVTIGLAFWLVFESESKSALAFAIIALVASWLMLMVCKRTRLTPAFIVAAVVVTSMLVSNPIERLGYRLYGDATLTGRTGIWSFIEYQISQRPWFGWGFHSYYFVPNSPQNEAPGFIKFMPSSHSGYRELKLETGRIGYWIFLVLIYSSLHLIERVRRVDPVRAGLYLSVQLFAVLSNLLDSSWLVLTHFWLLYVIVTAETVRSSLLSSVRVATPVGAVPAVRRGRPPRLTSGAPR
ncbi:MAG: O-antigen ligase family protein [Xanthobacteraceae bacterium]|nr:O-antigen ligase family protein [Xanthobacteraceae bacterium]